MAVSILTRSPIEIESPFVSGVVITGFGRGDSYPKLKSFVFKGVANNCLLYHEVITRMISPENRASIIPFAQSLNEVHAFVEGVDRLYQSTIEEKTEDLLSNYTNKVIEVLANTGVSDTGPFKQALHGHNKKLLERFTDELREYRRANFVDPVVQVVAMLPKHDLAAMAEALVNLSSLKKKITLEAETVGGPIDVAVISKGDGFIWIKRKHYFKSELNPQFFKNYTRNESHAAKKN